MGTIITDLIESIWLDIKIKKPYNVYNKEIYNIFYKNHQHLLIQTPPVSLPYSYSVYNDKCFIMDVIIDDEKFLNMLRRTIYHISSRIGILTDFQKDKNIIRLRNDNIASLKIFNANKELIDIRNLSRYDRIRAIFQIDKIIHDSDKNHTIFYLKVVQIRKEWQQGHDVIAEGKCLIASDPSQVRPLSQTSPRPISRPPPPPPRLPPPPPPRLPPPPPPPLPLAL